MIHVHISGDHIPIKVNSFQCARELDNRAVFSFVVMDIANTYGSFLRGQPVEVFDDEIALYDSADDYLYDSADAELVFENCNFSGYIEVSEKIPISRRADCDEFIHDVVCSGMMYLADKRLIALSMVDEYAGDVVREIVAQVLYEEGVTHTAESVIDGLVIKEAAFNYVPCTEALDALAEASNCWWDIDRDKIMYFQSRDAIAAPFVLTPSLVIGSPSVKTGNPLYRNVQWMSGGYDVTTEQVEIFVADGEQTSFQVAFPFNQKPTVEIYDPPGWTEESVEYRGTGITAPWYWERDSNTITQDSLETPLAANNKIRITYYGRIDIIVVDSDSAAILAQQTIEEGGSGKVENITLEKNMAGQDAILETAGAKLLKFAQASTTMKFTTEQSGLVVGQLLEVTGFTVLGIANDTELLVTKVEAYDIKGTILRFDVEACIGPAHASWAQLFKELDRMARPEIRLGMVDTSTIVMPNEFEKTWLEAERPNPFYLLAPGPLVRPGSTISPSLPFPKPITHCAVYDVGGELDRVPLAQLTGVGTSQIDSLAYFSSTQGVGTITHIGWIGGQHATSTPDSGEILDYQAWDKEKTASETLQIIKHDYKW